ncbi:MAG: hypothetical protein NZ918_03240 [Aigarchaeota archaeon]|nr:hypothetical protein [Aigarchaeota archaeon]
MSSFRDFSKIGVLMIGIALLIIAGIAVHFYTYYIQRAPSPPPPTPLYAYYRNNAVIVHANQEIVSVKVLDNRSNQIFFFEKNSKWLRRTMYGWGLWGLRGSIWRA